MLKYIRNEWMKLWAKKSTWTMLVLTILLAVVPAIVMKYTEDNEKDWRTVVQEDTNMYKSMLAEEGLAASDAAYFNEQIALNEYRLAEDVPLAVTTTFDSYLSYGVGLIIIVTIFSVVVAAGIVSSEFSTGTIKMLLTRPVSRTKILLSKLLTVILFGLLLYAVCLAGSSIIALILWGTDISHDLQMVDGVIKEVDTWGVIFEKFILSFGDFFMSIFFAFMLGSIFRSSSLAIGLTLVISMMGALIITLMSKYSFAKYVWISHSDLTQHASGGTPYLEGVTLPFSLTVLAVYAILFVLSSFIIFNKRDVTA
ncbi:ABC transporter permease [Lysinibacillus odysseyi]|uniref:ABC transporter n=1 Tax=Lysinibacillus odysseyi 34hs-1 = NBRC 100172 TaxID=1220589 RepID=A0A0A3IDQ3_9BACI|nr:ABC transporter permease [Lysinibacillus odysseyi]KGR82891.1 ABC transporter [Lysinibacillus odysseyi 34hs-1 = NBRC 100172]